MPILSAIEALEEYVVGQVQVWNEARGRAESGSEQYMTATARWYAYRDMAERLMELGEMVEREVGECQTE